ncbi:MAG: RNA-binding cell elongation regulator Jag/EloR [Eubacteriales bacterium]
MAALEVKGKTVDQAIFNGLNELGLGIDEVEIEILHDGRGLFGIGKNAVVRMTPRSEIKEAVTEKTKRSQPRKPEEKPDKEVQKSVESKIEKKGTSAFESTEPVDPSPAEDFLNELFVKMDVDAYCVTVQNNEIDKVVIEGKDTAALIGRRGETLDALQYLTGLVLNRGKQDYKRIMLDTENYREKREEALVRLANRIAVKVVKTGRKVTLEPMNPYERRILHFTLQSHPKVETISEGEEPFRRVVIRMKRRV